MIDKHFLFPEMYIAKVPKCDDCEKQVLQQTGHMLMSNPPLVEYVCPKCKKIYNYTQDELEGEWKWRVI